MSQHVDYASHHLDEVQRFYAALVGAHNVRADESTRSLFVMTAAGSSLGFMSPSEGPPEEWRPPREPSIYLLVEDVDRAYARLAGRDLEFQQAPTDMPWGHRVARLRDPEGRWVCLATPLLKKTP